MTDPSTTTAIGGDRPLRVCDICGQVDDHPRHVLSGGKGFPKPGNDILDKVIAVAPPAERGRLVNELLDTGASDRHMDCCREAGCPTGDCNKQTVGAEQLRGTDLLGHLVSKGGNR